MSTREQDFVAQVFVTSTHTPVLFFSSTGMAYKLKVYRLPVGTPQARGKPMINLLPLAADETISTLLPLPEDEDTWDDLFVMFTTAGGNVRRNRLSDFANVKANGKIAMKLGGGDRLVRVRTCTEEDDVLLATRGGKCLRFPVTDVRVFSGRTSTGVRGIRLAEGTRSSPCRRSPTWRRTRRPATPTCRGRRPAAAGRQRLRGPGRGPDPGRGPRRHPGARRPGRARRPGAVRPHP